MAIRHHTREKVAVVLKSDDAIDPDCYEDYIASGFDESKLTITNGSEPTRFHLRRVSYEGRNRLKELQLSGQLVEFANLGFRLGLSKSTGYVICGDDGRTLSLPALVHEADKDMGEIVPQKWVADSGIPFDVRLAIAGLTLKLSEGEIPFVKSSSTQPSDGDSKKSE